MPGPVTNRTRAVANRLHALPSDIVKAAADEISDTIRQQVRADTGGDGRLSGMGPRGGQLDVQSRPDSGADAALALTPTAPGIAAILEHGTRPHEVAAARGRKSRALKVAGQWVTGPVLVRGSPAKHTWSRGVDAGTHAAVTAAGDQFKKVIDGP